LAEANELLLWPGAGTDSFPVREHAGEQAHGLEELEFVAFSEQGFC